ncbi:MAG: DUF2029 domain-containing protein [Candidatus Obscuribacterales bacterium]|nr:DUF2029 domain-containing protein [Candidatus Obscuribacterales bacterium]
MKKPNVPDFAYACLLFYWFLSVIATLCGYLIKSPQLAYLNNGNLSLADFICFYEAGKIFLSNEAPRLYDYSFQLQVLNEIISPLRAEKVFAIPYSPPSFLLFAPLGLVSPANAFRIFSGLSILLCITSLLLSARSARRTALFTLFLLIGSMVSVPAQMTFHTGQLSCFLLFLLTSYFLCLKSKLDIWAGLALALLFVKPQYALFLLLPALIMKRWRCLLSASIFLISLSSIALLRFGINSFLIYPKYLFGLTDQSRYFGIFPQVHVNLRALLLQFAPAEISTALSLFAYVAGLAFCSFIWLKVKNRDSNPALPWLFAFTTISALFFSPHTHCNDGLLLAAAAAFTLPTLSPTLVLSLESLPLKIWSLTLIFLPLLGFLSLLFSAFYPDIRFHVQMLANLILLLSAAAYVSAPMKEDLQQ